MEGKQQLEKARERVIESIAQNMNLYGITPSIGRLYGLLFFHDDPMTLDDMKENLGMSKTSMSTSVRSLMELKIVEKVWKKGVRKDLYTVTDDPYQTFIDLFTIKWRKGISMNIASIERSIKELQRLTEEETTSDEIKTLAKKDIDKLEETVSYYHWLNRLVDSFETQDIFKYIPK